MFCNPVEPVTRFRLYFPQPWHARAVLATMLLGLAAQCAAQSSPALGEIALELRQHHGQAAMLDAAAALKSQPGDPRLWTLKGLAAQQLGDTRTALSAFDTSLRLAPNYLPALEGAAETAYSREPAMARPYIERVLHLEPGNATANAMAAMLDCRGGDWEAAVAHFNESGAGVYAQRGTLEAYAEALGHLGREVEAEPIFRKILETWPEDGEARYNLAVLQLRQDHAGDAIQTLQPLVDVHHPQALSLAASASEAAGDTPRAVTLLREAIRQSPKDPQNYLDFAALSFDHSSSAAGIAMLDAGLTQLPQSAPLWVARGVLYMQSAQVERAESDFATANRLDPSRSFGLEAQGLTAIQRHDLPGAFDKVRASLQGDPNNAYLDYLAAEILKEEGATPRTSEALEAIGYAERSIKIDPKLIAARDLLSSLYFQAGDLPRAEQQCRAALRQDPSDQESVFRLILILRRSGDKQHEIPALVANLGRLRAKAHQEQVKVDRYRLAVSPAP